MEEKPIAVFGTGLLGPPVVARLYQDEIAVVHGGRIRTEQRIRYEQIAQVVVRKGLQRSSLIIERTGGHALRVDGLGHITAEQAREGIQIRVQDARRSGTSASSASAPSIAAQIRELAELKEAGLITEEEFQTKKRNLLDRM
jgi:hypothetical protein